MTHTRDDLDIFTLPTFIDAARADKIEIGVTSDTFPTGQYTGVIFLNGAEVYRSEFGRGDVDAEELELAGTFAIFAVDSGLPEILQEHAEDIDVWGHDALPVGVASIRETIIASTGETSDDVRGGLLAALMLYTATQEAPYSVAAFTEFYRSEDVQARVRLVFPHQD